MVGKSDCHGCGDTGVECEADMLGKESKWCSAGEEMAESVSINEDMTSVDAGLTLTRFESRRLSLRWEVAGRERLRRSLGALAEVRAENLSGMMGLPDVSSMLGDDPSINGCVSRTAGSAHGFMQERLMPRGTEM